MATEGEMRQQLTVAHDEYVRAITRFLGGTNIWQGHAFTHDDEDWDLGVVFLGHKSNPTLAFRQAHVGANQHTLWKNAPNGLMLSSLAGLEALHGTLLGLACSALHRARYAEGVKLFERLTEKAKLLEDAPVQVAQNLYLIRQTHRGAKVPADFTLAVCVSQKSALRTARSYLEERGWKYAEREFPEGSAVIGAWDVLGATTFDALYIQAIEPGAIIDE